MQALGCESCTQKGGTAQASLKIPFRCLCYPTHPAVQYSPWALQTPPEGDFQMAPSVGEVMC